MSQTTFHTVANTVHAIVSPQRRYWGLGTMSDIPEMEPSSPSVDSRRAGVTSLGRVAAPPEHESTSGVFYFWVDRNQSVERTQIVTTTSNLAGRSVRFVGI